ncbi:MULTISPECIES: hypothetical protein [Myxococcus]|uniref:hypothetical protein n=1 Tax=Myxococcus TaxID=32 RepID=UPI001141A635|nr:MULTISPECIES: hypothetical protein [Myxococcus]NOK02912.1 hypothetical protein [Myxococcus xanthus]
MPTLAPAVPNDSDHLSCGCPEGQRVRIFAVLHGGTRPDADPDADDYYADTDEKLARLGGVTAEDRIDAAPIRPDGTTSFVHVDPRAIDLECFANLRK